MSVKQSRVACRFDSGCRCDCKTFARAWYSLEGQAKKRTWRMLTDFVLFWVSRLLH